MSDNNIKNNIIKSFNENKNSHAFLFSTNNLEKCNKDVKDIIKYICCTGTKKDDCNCNSCNLLKTGQNPDIIEIYPDGKEIKVDQVENILTKFVSKSSFSNYSVYLINEAEKLNLSSANKILKFLEEPNSNIIGFFITSNIQGVLTTIRSRCELFNYNFEKNNILDYLNISELEYEKYYKTAMELLIQLNEEKKYLLLASTKNYSKYERDEIIKLLFIVKKMYEIKYYYLIGQLNYNESFNEILTNIGTSDFKIVVNRLKLLDNILNECKFNVNKDLVFNKLFIVWE